uniref:Trafficking protein particle complex subunit 2-like protein n=1 Tax=Heterorhabditis bacteriophora TaxID=37862 RepID=A0A1I7XRZ1_HETBA
MLTIRQVQSSVYGRKIYCYAGTALGYFNVRLFNAISEKQKVNSYDVDLFIYCTLDIMDEKSPKANEMYLGHLYNDQKYKSFGFISNTGIRMVLVLEAGCLSLKDQEIRGIFKKFHTQYCNAISNPFYKFGEEIQSKFLNGIKDKQLSVVTVSPQSVCSISVKRGIRPFEAAQLISSYFLSKGISYVLDSSFGRLFCLEAAFEEFQSNATRPLLVSACPGFICYAEKTHGKLLVPLLSRIRSPQAIQGAIVKDYLARKLDIPLSSIYHASVMPCFDKKLESSRSDFLVPGSEVRETDCVLSTVELDSVLNEVTQIVPSEADGWLGDFARGVLLGNPGGSSGGFAEDLVRRFIAIHGGEPVRKQIAKNIDVTEVFVDGTMRLSVARVYGFRNIQNMVRKLKIGKCNYDYVEVMACPSGCGNGGGQLRADTTDERNELLNKVENAYESLNGTTDSLSTVMTEWSLLNPDWKNFLYTQYRIVETNISQTLQW